MPSYTLNYFNQRGRAEVCRLLFAYAGVQYNDKRYEMSEWNNSRNRMPCSMMPMLEFDNKFQLPQSMSIARYLAREFGLYGRNSMDQARIDYISDCFYDIMDDYMRMYHDKDGRMVFQRTSDQSSSPLYSERRSRFQETCRRILPYLERTLETYGGGNQWFLGDQITVADMMCYSALENPLFDDSNFLSSYPRIQGLRNRFINHPKISVYLKKRSRTDFLSQCKVNI